MPSVRRTLEELEANLKAQVAFLLGSCAAYDKRLRDEACRLAVSVRVLVHDTAVSKSLLGQLGVKHDMKFLDTCWEYNPRSSIPFNGLVLIKSVFSSGCSTSDARRDCTSRSSARPSE